MKILGRWEALKRLSAKHKQNDQGLIDFLNDSGMALDAVKHGIPDWQEPPASMTFEIIGVIRLHYVEERAGKLVLRAESCGNERAEALMGYDAGVGEAGIRAQLYQASKRRGAVVFAK